MRRDASNTLHRHALQVDLSALGPLVQGLLGSAGGARITPSITSLHPPSVAVQAQQEVDLGGLLAAWARECGRPGMQCDVWCSCALM